MRKTAELAAGVIARAEKLVGDFRMRGTGIRAFANG
jgi:hypothetical protein